MIMTARFVLLVQIGVLLGLCGCKKEQPNVDYTLFIKARSQSNSGDYNLQKIAFTNDEGQVVAQFPMSNPSYTFDFQPTFSANDDSLQVHFVYTNTVNGTEVVHVRTFLGIPLGDTLVVDPEVYAYYPAQIGKKIEVLVSQLPPLDSVDVLLDVNDNLPNYDPTGRRLTIKATVHNQQDLLIRVKVKGEAGFRYLFVPFKDLKEGEINFFAGTDFLPELTTKTVSKPTTILSAPETYYFVAALSEDRVKMTVLNFYYPLRSNQIALKNSFNVPPALLAESRNFYVSLKTPDYEIEKIFKNNEALVFESFPVNIDFFWTNGERMKTSFIGPVDMGEIEATGEGVWPNLRWNLYGHPASLSQFLVPDLSPVLPNWKKLSAELNRYQVSAHYYKQHDWTQLRRGLPYSEKAWFALGNSGYWVVRKRF